jgi:hypothetical protein
VPLCSKLWASGPWASGPQIYLFIIHHLNPEDVARGRQFEGVYLFITFIYIIVFYFINQEDGANGPQLERTYLFIIIHLYHFILFY